MKDLITLIEYTFEVKEFNNSPLFYAVGFTTLNNSIRFISVISKEELLEMKHTIEDALSGNIKVSVDYGQNGDKSATVTIKKLPDGTYQITDIQVK